MENEVYLKLQNLSKKDLVDLIYNFWNDLYNCKEYMNTVITYSNQYDQILIRNKIGISNLLKARIFSIQNKITKEDLEDLGFKFEKQNPFTGKPNWYFSKYQIENPEITSIDTATLIDFDLEKFEARYENHIKICETISELKQFIDVVKYLSNFDKLNIID